ncbi:WD40/YVTN/BNR-like repeat-containing protein [Paenibacillus pini]|uniref:Photosynthesis system II assembly factor Ycf48/Hcf136-like domain-containing protein n=1 Tax=Paenibacillus pini JCM 16418 TaxID=1236976 RepID=W7Z0H3_9BACL|nr:hypothetical protein [Paenibacillus pini]GAF10456.1 hypothetical protein JCM16418_4663 [Paenibacillus pini JCM 16418]
MIIHKALKRSALTLAALALLVPVSWGTSEGKVAAQASKAPVTCGTGDHGLLQNIQKQHTGSDKEPFQFTDIQFLTAQKGRAAGTGFMIGTSDAGCQWQEIYTGQWQFKQIDFPDNTNGWALATLPGQTTKYLIQTSDGGSHWKKVTNGGIAFDRIDLINKQTAVGYALNTAYRTTNGGLNWVKIKTPANTRYTSFEDLKKGYVLTVVPSGGYTVKKTIDGGLTWRTQLDVKTQPDMTIGGQVYSKGNQVWALMFGGSGMSQVSYSLYGSSDQGGHWKKVISQATAGGGPAPGGGSGVVNQGPAMPGGHPSNMQLAGSSTAFLVGGSPAGGMVGIGRTYDGGKTWKNVKPDINGYDARISFIDGNIGWLAVTSPTKSSIYETMNGGATWNRKFATKEALKP